MQKELPKGWKWVRLGEVCEFIKNGLNIKQSDNGRLPITRIETISNGKIDENKVKYIEPTEEEYKKYRLLKGDILFSHINSVEHLAKTAIYSGEPKELIHGINLLLLRPNKTIYPIFFHYWLTKESTRNLFRTKARKAVNQASLNTKDIVSVLTPLPPLPTQHKIVEILEEADNLRKLRQQADEKMKDLIPSLFVQMFGDPARNPKGWEVGKIGDVCNKNTGARNPSDIKDGHFEYVDIASIDNIRGIITNSRTIHNIEAPSRARKIIKTNDVLVSTVRPNLNAVAIVPSILNNQICSTGFCVLRIYPEISRHHYIYAITRSKFFVETMTKKTQGASYPAVSDKDIYDFPIPLPPHPLQHEFAKLVDDIEAEKHRQAEGRKKLDELFNSLMQKAFTGELAA